MRNRFETVEQGAHRMGWVIGNAALRKSRTGHVTFGEAVLYEVIIHWADVPLSMRDMLKAPQEFQAGIDRAYAESILKESRDV